MFSLNDAYGNTGVYGGLDRATYPSWEGLVIPSAGAVLTRATFIPTLLKAVKNSGGEALDFVVMSHRHGDHMGRLAYLLKTKPKMRIYAPKEAFGVYGADLPSGFYRKDPSLPLEQRYYIGVPPEVMRLGSPYYLAVKER